MNIAMLLEMAAEGDPERVVLGSHDGGTTAAELLERARRAAVYFEKSGAEVVGYFGVNSDVLPGGALRGGAGGRAVHADQLSSARRAADGHPRARGRRTDDRRRRRSGAAAARAAPTTVVTKGEFASAIAEPVTGEHPFVDPEEIAVLLFTSGTTSEPKAAVLRHRHLVSYIISSVEFLGCSPEEAQLICVPPYHIAGIAAVLSSLYAGRRIMYLPSFDAASWVRLAVDERITHAMVVPTMLGRILAAVEEAGVEPPALRHLSYGGGRMPLELVERTLRDMPHVDLVNAYGLTETSSTIAMLTPDDHREAFASDDPAVRARLGSVGRPLPSLEVEVRGADDAELPPGEKGEIWVRGEQVAGEYVGNNVLTEDGWFRTRDAGWFDTDGLLVRRRAARRRDRAGRGEHLARRGGRGAHGARGRRRGRRHRHPRRRVGRGGGGRGGPAPGCRRPRRPSCRTGCGPGCARPRCPASWSSATSCRTRRPGSCCVGCCETSSRRRWAGLRRVLGGRFQGASPRSLDVESEGRGFGHSVPRLVPRRRAPG